MESYLYSSIIGVDMQYLNTDHPDAKFVLAFSGGVDSVLLFDYLIKNDVNFRAIHIVHGNSLSDYAALDLVTKYCYDNIVTLSIYHCSCTTETEGRNGRLEIFKKYVANDEVVLMGHHADDSIETMLYNLFSGATINGMCGIAHDSYFDGIHIIRPFIHENKTKDEILKEAFENKLVYVNDEMNEDMSMKRNIIRKMIIPTISTFFPLAKQKMFEFIQSANKQREMNAYLYNVINDHLVVCFDAQSYSIDKMLCMLSDGKLAILENWFFYQMKSAYGFQLTKRHFSEFLTFIENTEYKKMSLPDNKYLAKCDKAIVFK